MKSSAPVSRWWYTATLLVTYFVTFCLWQLATPQQIRLSAFAVFVTLMFFLREAAVSGYFHNRVELFAHASAICDLFVEGLLRDEQPHGAFGLCTLSFTVLFIGYRLFLIGKAENQPVQAWISNSNGLDEKHER